MVKPFHCIPNWSACSSPNCLALIQFPSNASWKAASRRWSRYRGSATYVGDRMESWFLALTLPRRGCCGHVREWTSEWKLCPSHSIWLSNKLILKKKKKTLWQVQPNIKKTLEKFTNCPTKLKYNSKDLLDLKCYIHIQTEQKVGDTMKLKDKFIVVQTLKSVQFFS